MQSQRNAISLRPDSLEAWSKAIIAAGIRLESRNLFESKASRYERLRAWGLLKTPCLTLTVHEFLTAPRKYLELVPGAKLIPFLEPAYMAGTCQHFSSRPILREHFVAALRRATQGLTRRHCSITFLKAFDILCNGNIIVRKDADLYAEFVVGARSPSQQNVEIGCIVRRDPFLGILRYSSKNLELRGRIYDLISSLPKRGPRNVYLPGYYEVALGHDKENDVEIPLFYDFRQGSAFISPALPCATTTLLPATAQAVT